MFRWLHDPGVSAGQVGELDGGARKLDHQKEAATAALQGVSGRGGVRERSRTDCVKSWSVPTSRVQHGPCEFDLFCGEKK